jgi:hypothetical protein
MDVGGFKQRANHRGFQRSMNTLGRLVIYVVVLAAPLTAQNWSPFLTLVPPGQKGVTGTAIDWSATGIPGGVPSGTWTQCGSTIQASTYGNGSTDATAAINAAISACGTNQYVLLGPGTFLFNSSGSGSPTINLSTNNVVLRGTAADGANATILSSTGTNQDGWINVGTGEPNINWDTTIVSGSTAQSTSIVVSSATNFAVGMYMIISELNDTSGTPPLVVSLPTTPSDSNGCTWCDAFWGGTRVRRQTVEITGVNGTTITFSPPLATDFTLTPHALPYVATKYVGVENLQVYGNNTHTANRNAPFVFNDCAYCWVKGVMVNYTDGDYVKDYFGFRNEIRDSYFSNGFHHGPGSDNNCVLLAWSTSFDRVENNIIERAENSVMIYGGAMGNVIAYNYATGAFGTDSSNNTRVIVGGIEHHAAHTHFNLFEGNIDSQYWLDVGHGSNSQNTTFRNWFLGDNLICSNAQDLRVSPATITCGTGWASMGATAYRFDSLGLYNNSIGDVLGSHAQSTYRSPLTASIQYPTQLSSCTGPGQGVIYGYTLYCDNGTSSWDSTYAYSTSYVHGLYNNIDSSTTWKSGVTQTLPNSFYLSSKPAWWGNTLPWPGIGPDITGGTVSANADGPPPGGHAYMNPAMACYYNVMGGKEGGAGSPLSTFDPVACYQSLPPAPPTGVTAVAH